MKVKCILNDKSVLPTDMKDRYFEYLDDQGIVLGKEYTVYALGSFMNSVWYSVFSENFSSFPIYKHFCFFEISDPRLSRYWIFDLCLDKSPDFEVYLSFPEWIKEKYFYSNLVDGEQRERRIFNRYKELMDLEFPDSSITKSAQLGDENWLICPDCLDAWESRNNIDALVKCPICEQVFNNPRYAQT